MVPRVGDCRWNCRLLEKAYIFAMSMALRMSHAHPLRASKYEVVSAHIAEFHDALPTCRGIKLSLCGGYPLSLGKMGISFHGTFQIDS